MSSNKSNNIVEENGKISNGEITKSIKDERVNSKNEKTFENVSISTTADKFNYDIVSKILLLFIMLSPVFDIISFLFRNKFDSKISISTFIRPIIPVFVAIYIFFTANKKNKKIFISLATIYILYAIIHLIIANKLFTGCSDGNIINETQYIFNFTFLVIDLIIYLYTFIYEGKIKGKAKTKINSSISNSMLIMVAIYLITIFVSIITKTSSFTYIETKTGYKGWIESGNSLSAILVISLFIILPNINFSNWKNKSKKIKAVEITKVLIVVCDFAYLTTILGTRTGLIGAFLAVFCYIIVESIFNKNKKIIYCGIIFMIVGVTAISMFGSKTLKRRAQMKQSQFTIIDKSTGEIGNMTGDMLDIKNKIIDGTIEQGFMSEPQKQATLDLYKYAKKHNIAGNDTRRQQLIYNVFLVKHQKNLLYILFGNGFKTNFREMVMENELASLILNFGILGFILYVAPLIIVLVIATKNIICNIINLIKFENIAKARDKKNSFNENIKDNEEVIVKRNEIENNNTKMKIKNQIMYQFALALVLILSWLSGYVLFATSSMIVISSVVILNLINVTC